MLRSINIANDKKRDALVGFESSKKEKNISYVLKNGDKPTNVKLLKTTSDFNLEKLLETHESLNNLANAIIESDPEVDMEHVGMKIEFTNKIYITEDNKIQYGVDLYEIVYNPDSTEKERRYYNKVQSNINTDIPIKCSGKLIPKDEAVKRFVFNTKYQLRHISGLTYDFLFNMADQLQKSNSLMLVGGGKNGNEPLIFTEGGTSYRGFLEGRTLDNKYILILHLTNLELKELN